MDEADDDLIRRWQQNGDERARDTLLRRHQPLLRAEAYRATLAGHDFDDAYQLAAMGFCHAMDKYEFGHGASLRTYALRWIRQRLHHGRQWLGPVHRPTYVLDATARIHRERRSMRNQGIEPTAAELAARTGTPASNVELFLASAQATVPLDAPVGDSGGGSFVDLLADDRVSPEDILEQRQRRQLLVEAIDTLPPKQAETARLYYLEDRTLEEIGAMRGISRQGAHLSLQAAQAGLIRWLGG